MALERWGSGTGTAWSELVVAGRRFASHLYLGRWMNAFFLKVHFCFVCVGECVVYFFLIACIEKFMRTCLMDHTFAVAFIAVFLLA